MTPTKISQPVSSTGSRLSGAGLANFLALRGRRIYEACCVLWHSVPGRFLMNLPYQQSLEPSPEELQDLIRFAGAVGVRFTSERWCGLEGGIYIRHKCRYDLNSVQVKHRARVRKGMETVEVRPVEEAELLDQGLQLNLETMSRQTRFDPEFGEAKSWNRFVKAMRDCPEISAVGAFEGSLLLAYMIVCKEDRWLNILHQMSRLEHLKSFPNHVLTYSVTKTACEDPSLDGICYGLVSLVDTAGLHEYKLRFGYEVVRRSCSFVLNPRLDPLLNNPVARWGVRQLRKLRPKDERLGMVDTVLRGAALTSCGALPGESRS
jgi:hypothetical protein